MKKPLGVLILLILFCSVKAFGAPGAANQVPSDSSPMEHDRAPEQAPPSSAPDFLNKNALQDSAPSPEALKPSALEFFYGHTRAISVYGGGVYLTQSGLLYGLGGISYMFHSLSRFHFEGAFDALGTLESHFRFMGKWYIKGTRRLRTYFNLGAGVRVMSQDNIAVFLSWPRLLFQTGAGAEWSFSQDFSVRGEAFAAADLSNNAYGGFTLGLSVGF